MSNRLSESKSRYLLQHARNPVNWYPWGEEALQKSKKEDKPIFLSIGYSSCHWCHVMERESFSDPEVAELLNENFVAVKLDREERPDIDALYMKAVQVLTGQGGWPLNVFLTSDLRPFFGGTYFPPTANYSLPAFKDLLKNIAEAYRSRPEEIRQNSDQLSNILFQSGRYFEKASHLSKEFWKRSVQNIVAQFDTREGGLGEAPKFFHVDAFRLLLREASEESSAMARLFLDKISAGGIHDHVAGGFHRYSTDREWKTPHYEKMLYDNALLAELFVEAYQRFGRESDRWVACRILDWCLREMRREDGLFYSSVDADSEGVEGAFYMWSTEELLSVLGQEHPALELLLCEGGLRLKKFPVTEQEWRSYSDAMAKLSERRARRPRPGVDDKVQSSWNALLIQSLFLAGFAFDRSDYTEAAVQACDRIWELRSARAGRFSHVLYESDLGEQPLFLEDQAYLSLAFIHGALKTGEARLFRYARVSLEELIAHFEDKEAGGFWVNARTQRDVLFNTKEVHDSALPSPYAVAIEALSIWAPLEPSEDRARVLSRALELIAGTAEKEPGGFQRLALWSQQNEARSFLIFDRKRPVDANLRRHFLASCLIARADFEDSDLPPLLSKSVSSSPAYQICGKSSCQEPKEDWRQAVQGLENFHTP